MKQYLFTDLKDPMFTGSTNTQELNRAGFAYCGNAGLDSAGRGCDLIAVSPLASDASLIKLAQRFAHLGLSLAEAIEARTQSMAAQTVAA